MPDHGQRARYLRGCRCEPCRDAHRRYCKWYRLATRSETRRGPRNSLPTEPMRVPPAPILGHLAALTASGWRQADIARETGIDSGYLSRLIAGQFRGVHRRNAAALLALAPLAPVEVDEVVVERLVAGADWRALSATRAEREAAWRTIRDANAAQGRRFGQNALDGLEGTYAAAKRLGFAGRAVAAIREAS